MIIPYSILNPAGVLHNCPIALYVKSMTPIEKGATVFKIIDCEHTPSEHFYIVEPIIHFDLDVFTYSLVGLF